MSKRKRRKRKLLLAVKNAVAIKKLKKGVEHKYKSTSFAIEDIDTVGSIHYMNTIAVGNDVETRNGNEVTATHLHIRGYVAEQGAGADGIGRLLIGRWRKKEDTRQIVITDFLNTVNIVSATNLLEAGNYKIYYDETFPIDVSVHSNIPFKIDIKLNSVIKYNNDGVGDETDCITNALYIMFMSNIVSGENCPHLYASWRLSYTDG